MGLLLFCVLLIAASGMQITYITTLGSGSFNDPSRWSGGVVPGPSDDVVIATQLPASGIPVTVTVTSPGTTVQSLVLAGSGVVLDAAQGISVAGSLLMQSGATFVTGLAASAADSLTMMNSVYRVQVTALPPLGVLQVAGAADFHASTLVVDTTVPAGNNAWLGAGPNQVMLFYGSATTAFAAVNALPGQSFVYLPVRYAVAFAAERYIASPPLAVATSAAAVVVPTLPVSPVNGYIFAIGPAVVAMGLLLFAIIFFIMSRFNQQYLPLEDDEEYVRETTITTSQPRSEPVLAAVASVRSHSDDYDYEVATPEPAGSFGGGKEKQSWHESNSHSAEVESRRLSGAMPLEMPPQPLKTRMPSDDRFFQSGDIPLSDMPRAGTMRPPPSLAPPPPLEPTPVVPATVLTEKFSEDDDVRPEPPAFPSQELKMEQLSQPAFPPAPAAVVADDDEEDEGPEAFPEPPATMMFGAPPESPPQSRFVAPPPPATMVMEHPVARAVEERVEAPKEQKQPTPRFEEEAAAAAVAAPLLAPVSLSTPGAGSMSFIPLKIVLPEASGLGTQNVLVPAKFSGQEALEYVQAKLGGAVSAARMGLRVDSAAFLHGDEAFRREETFPFLAPEKPLEEYGVALHNCKLHWDERQTLLKVRFLPESFPIRSKNYVLPYEWTVERVQSHIIAALASSGADATGFRLRVPDDADHTPAMGPVVRQLIFSCPDFPFLDAASPLRKYQELVRTAPFLVMMGPPEPPAAAPAVVVTTDVSGQERGEEEAAAAAALVAPPSIVTAVPTGTLGVQVAFPAETHLAVQTFQLPGDCTIADAMELIREATGNVLGSSASLCVDPMSKHVGAFANAPSFPYFDPGSSLNAYRDVLLRNVVYWRNAAFEDASEGGVAAAAAVADAHPNEYLMKVEFHPDAPIAKKQFWIPYSATMGEATQRVAEFLADRGLDTAGYQLAFAPEHVPAIVAESFVSPDTTLQQLRPALVQVESLQFRHPQQPWPTKKARPMLAREPPQDHVRFSTFLKSEIDRSPVTKAQEEKKKTAAAAGPGLLERMGSRVGKREEPRSTADTMFTTPEKAPEATGVYSDLVVDVNAMPMPVDEDEVNALQQQQQQQRKAATPASPFKIAASTAAEADAAAAAAAQGSGSGDEGKSVSFLEKIGLKRDKTKSSLPTTVPEDDDSSKSEDKIVATYGDDRRKRGDVVVADAISEAPEQEYRSEPEGMLSAPPPPRDDEYEIGPDGSVRAKNAPKPAAAPSKNVYSELIVPVPEDNVTRNVKPAKEEAAADRPRSRNPRLDRLQDVVETAQAKDKGEGAAAAAKAEEARRNAAAAEEEHRRKTNPTLERVQQRANQGAPPVAPLAPAAEAAGQQKEPARNPKLERLMQTVKEDDGETVATAELGEEVAEERGVED